MKFKAWHAILPETLMGAGLQAFAKSSYFSGQPVGMPCFVEAMSFAIFKISGKEGILSLILHGKQTTRERLFVIVIEAISKLNMGVIEFNCICFRCLVEGAATYYRQRKKQCR